MNAQACNTCGVSKPLTTTFFRESSRKRHGKVVWFFRPRCRACEAIADRKKYLRQSGNRTIIGDQTRRKCTRCNEKRLKAEFRPKFHSNELHPWCDECREEFE